MRGSWHNQSPVTEATSYSFTSNAQSAVAVQEVATAVLISFAGQVTWETLLPVENTLQT